MTQIAAVLASSPRMPPLGPPVQARYQPAAGPRRSFEHALLSLLARYDGLAGPGYQAACPANALSAAAAATGLQPVEGCSPPHQPSAHIHCMARMVEGIEGTSRGCRALMMLLFAAATESGCWQVRFSTQCTV